ncbi:MAG: AAA family ATPase, partial [Myxococcota bacterium]
LFDEPQSFAVQLLEKQGLSHLDLMLAIQLLHEEENFVLSKEEEGLWQVEPHALDEDAIFMDEEEETDVLEEYTILLNDLAKAGELDPLIGREEELSRAIQVLARRRKHHPLFLGESGVGKTALAEGLALRIQRGQVPDSLKYAKIYRLDMASLLAGTRYRGDFESRLKSVVKALEREAHAILYIDEVHTIMGAGATSGSNVDAANLLKPLLTSGRLRCMGSTSFKEFRQTIEKDRALARRFQCIHVEEPSLQETLEILQGLRNTYESFHQVTYAPDVLLHAVHLSERYLHDRRLPDKAIDLMDEAGAWTKLHLKSHPIVTLQVVQDMVARMAKIPPEEVSQGDRQRIQRLQGDLQCMVFGQDQAIEQLVSAVKLSRAGLSDEEKPMGSFLFTGPTGVGKTEVARQLADTLGMPLVRFDMSEYMEKHAVSRLLGAPPGYVGFEQGGLLTDAVSKSPYCVLLLDEIEKAHPELFHLLLQVMDYGKLTDHNGQQTDFRHVILIMTSNVGARDWAAKSIGFATGLSGQQDEKAYRSLFSPEFRNRLDARIAFAPLEHRVMQDVVRKFLAQLQSQLQKKDVALHCSPEAIRFLAEVGYDPAMGARPLHRIIREHVKLPLSEAMLFGELEHGGSVWMDCKEKTLDFVFGPPEPFEKGKRKKRQKAPAEVKA